MRYQDLERAVAEAQRIEDFRLGLADRDDALGRGVEGDRLAAILKGQRVLGRRRGSRGDGRSP